MTTPSLWGRQPAAWIGLIVSLVVAVVGVLSGQGFINDVVAGKVTSATNALATIATIAAPLIAGILIKSQVTPTAAPVLDAGTPVTTPAGDAAVVAHVDTVMTSSTGGIVGVSVTQPVLAAPTNGTSDDALKAYNVTVTDAQAALVAALAAQHQRVVDALAAAATTMPP